MADIGTAYIRVAPNMSGIQGKIAGGLKGSGSQFARQFGGEISGKSAAIIGAIAGIAQAATTKVVSIIRDSIGSAVARVDTLKAFPKVLKSMGVGSDEARAATNKLSKSLKGLPTPLQDGATGVQQFIAAGLPASKATDAYLAMNNALLATGGNAQDTGIVMESLTRALSGGTTQATTIQAALSRMPTALQGLERATGKSAGALYKLYAANPQKLADDLINLNKNGGGGLASLAVQAREATGGIGTSFTNMQQAVVRGLANIIMAIGQENISNAVKAVGNAFESVLNAVAKSIPPIINYIKQVVGFIVKWKDVLGPVAVGILAIGAAFATIKTVSAIATVASDIKNVISVAGLGAGALKQYATSTKVAAAAQAILNAVMDANPITLIALAIIGLVAALAYFFTQTETGKKIFAGFLSTIKPVVSFIGAQFNSAFKSLSSIFSQAAKALSPLVNGIVNFVKAIVSNKTVMNVLKYIGLALLAIAAAPILGFFATLIAGLKIISVVLGFVAKNFTLFKNIILIALAPILVPIALLITAIKAIPPVISAVGAAIGVAFNAIASFWTSVLQPIFSVMINIIQTIFSIYVKVWSAIALVIVGTMFIIAGVIGSVMRTIWGVISSVWNAIWGVISAVVGTIRGVIVRAWNFYFSIISGVVHKVFSVVSSIFRSISGFIGGIFGTIGRVVSRAWNGFYNTISRAVGRVWSSVRNIFGKVVSFVGGIGGRIVRGIGNLGNTLYQKGRDLINGLLKGAGSLLGKIGEFFLNKLPGPIRGAFKKALGISSPSKVFAGYGTNIVEGLINGIDGNSKHVTKAVNSMADSAIASMNGIKLNTDIAATANVRSNLTSVPANNQSNTSDKRPVYIEKVVLADQSAVKEFFTQLDQNSLLASKGFAQKGGYSG